MSWIENAKAFYIAETAYMERERMEGVNVPHGTIVDALQLELDTIRRCRDLLKELRHESRKRVWFYLDD